MCGIVGFFDQTHKHNIATLQSMVEQLIHRGPDSRGYFFESINDVQVALGHTRLAIIDVSPLANQPMIFDDWVIVYNGEVYNFHEIKNELLKHNYNFSLNSDTEVIIKAFDCWGIRSIEKFRGMFAFCIFNKKNKRAYLVRDRAGVKPLYYVHKDEHLIFSSELKSFFNYSGFKKKIYEPGLISYLKYGYIVAPLTIFQDAKKIRPGHYLEYDLITNTLIEKKYWDLSVYYSLPKVQIDEEEASESLHSLLDESFSLRMVADVPVGIFLSSGIDSSLIASILQSKTISNINTFTVGFENDKYDESRDAKNIAKYLGTLHHDLMCKVQDAQRIIHQIPEMYDEPFADSSCIPTALVSQFAKQKVSAVLSGEGGDELFCGYDSYLTNNNRFLKLDHIPFKKLFNILIKQIPDPIMALYKLNYDQYSRYLKLKSIISINEIEQRYDSIIHTFTSYDINKLLIKSTYPQTTIQIEPTLNRLERMMLFDFNQYLPDDLMVKVDRATMFHSLEGREPLLDHKILEFAAQLPLNFKLNKNILKNILLKYLPLSYFNRTKHGFGVPINSWLKNELYSLLKRYLDTFKLSQQDIFNVKYIQDLCQSFLHSKTNDNRIWTLIVFQMWYEINFNEHF